MATKERYPSRKGTSSAGAGAHVSTDTESLLLAALEQGGDASKTGRFLVTFKEGAADAAVKHLRSKTGMRLAHARDFKDQAVVLEETGDADAVVFPEIHVALLGGPAAEAHALTAAATIAS